MLFTMWLTCMGGMTPVDFLTDQDAAMRKAMAKVMPDTRHRWCIWHIMQKFSKKLGAYDWYEEIKVELQNAIYDSHTTDEFEDVWFTAVKKFNLEDNKWFSGQLFCSCIQLHFLVCILQSSNSNVLMNGN